MGASRLTQQTPATSDTPRPSKPKAKHNDESIKETCESIVIAFVLAFVFRAYVVEAFVIPTGSMAPTLLGQHVRVPCRQCGFLFKVEPREKDLIQRSPSGRGVVVGSDLNRPVNFVCPMCHFPNRLPDGAKVSAGDRILVHKFIYSMTEPRRWDVIVFKAPHQPDMNYIKRLVGLPEEKIWLVEGNIYVQSTKEGSDGSWRIARKTDRPDVQRAIWQPIYHSRYVPLDDGSTGPGRRLHPWKLPWIAKEGDWDLGQPTQYHLTTDQPGQLSFDFRTADRGAGTAASYYYNQFKLRYTLGNPERIEDIRVAATFLPERSGLAATLQTTSRLDTPDGRSLVLSATIDNSGQATLTATDPATGQARTLDGPADVGPFAAGHGRDIELWYADQEACLWVDGQRVLKYTFDLPMDLVQSRRLADPYPEVSIKATGSPVTITNVQIDRDLYYSVVTATGTTARAGYFKSHSISRGTPVELLADQFFCLGDNSPMSHDSRYWDLVDPWVEKRLFPPNLISDDHLGIVPRRLIMGRAFFVYFPAPLRIRPKTVGIFPNFGEMRFIH